MWKDPIVEEVRKYRREIEMENKGDFSIIFVKAKEIEKSLKSNNISDAPGKRSKRKTKITP